MPNYSMISGKQLIDKLASTIDKVLKPLVPAGASCALLEFPNYANSGDSVIWLGAKAWLRRNRNTVVYSCDKETYSRELMAAQLGSGIILLQGGGNFGDIWTDLQHFRERVIQDFPSNKIIQLPQTLHFRQEASIARTRLILEAHPDLTLLVRDQASLDFARQQFAVPATLCPDMAFALGPVERPHQAQTDMVWLARTDKETQNKPAPQNELGLICTDWLEEPHSALRDLNEQLSRDLKQLPDKAPELYRGLVGTYDPIARERFLRGITTLSQGHVVVTDRLHGHIMCLLLDIPHVLMDNNYGKVRGFYEAWTRDNKLTCWADSPEEVVNTAFSDTRFRDVLQTKGINLTTLDRLVGRLKASMETQTGWITAGEKAKLLWKTQLNQTREDILACVGIGQPFILVDEDQIRTELNLNAGTVIPFSGQEQGYLGPPVDDDAAIQALAQMRKNKAGFIAIAWPAFWWLDYYTRFAQHLRTNFQCMLKNERIEMYDLRA
ncbi:hypothetical protein GCM10023187_18610 [Nibrella viscosa]|uniref:Polysaccharide pyruvyl transferase domain-containing protein n=1 Tax=Nibrella viscosa TaxID=1084524 RepID=A0ABP8K9X5_9BACT